MYIHMYKRAWRRRENLQEIKVQLVVLIKIINRNIYIYLYTIQTIYIQIYAHTYTRSHKCGSWIDCLRAGTRNEIHCILHSKKWKTKQLHRSFNISNFNFNLILFQLIFFRSEKFVPKLILNAQFVWKL